ncbi:MAG: NADH-quinone oxidoreductase subunit NuoF [Promethearchaeota archaeon]
MTSTNEKRAILVCRGSGCNSMNAGFIHETMKELLIKNNLNKKVDLKLTGCHGFCQVGPTLIIEPDNVLYVHLKKADLEEIVKQHLINNQIIENLLYEDPKTGNKIAKVQDIQFYKEQYPIITKNCGEINPEEIEEYIERGGYSSVKKVLNEMKPIEVIEEVKKSGLRGRGGAGFSTGLKWQFCYDVNDSPKYLICNADEGDPGAFMDRSILESDPHSIIEGMIIAAYAIGANSGYVYVRAEYPLAIERFNIALEQARNKNLIGDNILGSDFSFDVELKKGAGAFVCGEETALMASIMGKRGVPRPKPPFPATSGLWNKPTNINNVKTFAFIPHIIKKGADWFASLGSDDATGTMVICLTGKVKNSGLVEVPMGTSIQKLIFDIGGGILNDRKFKALQTGGPSGGCIPAKFIETPLDYSHLTELGSIMGSGGFIVLDEDTCMVELARYFISFTQNESCGKCAPCRIGTKKMLNILTKIVKGNANMEDLDELERIANVVRKSSLCALGQTAPNPVLTTLKYFREEYEAHIQQKSCPALVCEDLIEYFIDKDLCTGCGICKTNCSSGAIIGEKKQLHEIDTYLCVKCGICFSACPTKAILKKNKY